MKYSNIYLVDYENIGKTYEVPCNSLVCYITSNKKMVDKKLSDNELEIHMTHNKEKNALDFVLDSYLGYLVHQYGRNVRYHIVSKDKGYDVVAKFWDSRGFKCERLDIIPRSSVSRVVLPFIAFLSEKKRKNFDNICIHRLNSVFNSYDNLYADLRKSLSKKLSDDSISYLASQVYSYSRNSLILCIKNGVIIKSDNLSASDFKKLKNIARSLGNNLCVQRLYTAVLRSNLRHKLTLEDIKTIIPYYTYMK